MKAARTVVHYRPDIACGAAGDGAESTAEYHKFTCDECEGALHGPKSGSFQSRLKKLVKSNDGRMLISTDEAEKILWLLDEVRRHLDTSKRLREGLAIEFGKEGS